MSQAIDLTDLPRSASQHGWKLIACLLPTLDVVVDIPDAFDARRPFDGDAMLRLDLVDINRTGGASRC